MSFRQGNVIPGRDLFSLSFFHHGFCHKACHAGFAVQGITPKQAFYKLLLPGASRIGSTKQAAACQSRHRSAGDRLVRVLKFFTHCCNRSSPPGNRKPPSLRRRISVRSTPHTSPAKLKMLLRILCSCAKITSMIRLTVSVESTT